MNVAIACGGTGGHIFPGLAVAEVLRRQGHAVVLWLSGRNIETVSAAGWIGRVEVVAARGFGGGPSLRWLGVLWQLAAARRECRRRLAADPPDVLLAMGSYASVGPGLAARSLGLPLVVHEANAVPGRAVSLLSRRAAVTALGCAQAADRLPGRRTAVTGFPLRASLWGDGRLETPAAGGLTILVMGGSQGAQRLNADVPPALGRLRRDGIDVGAIHMAGAGGVDAVRARYREEAVPARVMAFCDDMGAAYRAADVAITRAGAATCAELAALGVPAVLVPLPSARRDHQTANARVMQATGGVAVLPQKDMTPAALASTIRTLAATPEQLEACRAGLTAAAVPDAAERLARLVIEEGKRHADL